MRNVCAEPKRRSACSARRMITPARRRRSSRASRTSRSEARNWPKSGTVSTTIATSSRCRRSAAFLRVATTSTATSSIANTPQISQLATKATVCQPPDALRSVTGRNRRQRFLTCLRRFGGLPFALGFHRLRPLVSPNAPYRERESACCERRRRCTDCEPSLTARGRTQISSPRGPADSRASEPSLRGSSDGTATGRCSAA
jgi:hypothetical protein